MFQTRYSEWEYIIRFPVHPHKKEQLKIHNIRLFPMQKSPLIPLQFASEKYFDCKSVEVKGDLVQRRCWLKSSTSNKENCSPSFTKATGTNQDGDSTRVYDIDDDNVQLEASRSREKRKYFATKSYHSNYALDYLDQDVEQVHAKLRKDWFCMESDCNRYDTKLRAITRLW